MKSSAETGINNLKYLTVSAWVNGYADGLPEHCEIEKHRLREAATLLMNIFIEQNGELDGPDHD